jgi:predicted dehydrogenase
MYKTVIVGCGKIAGLYDNRFASGPILSHAAAYKENRHFELSGCVDIDSRTAKKFAEKNSISSSGIDLTAILDCVKPDLVSITSPDDAHFSCLKEIYEGKGHLPRAIFLEKPACRDKYELQSLINFSDKTGVPIVVNHTRRFDSEYLQLKSRYEQDYFGELLGVEATYYGGWLHSGIHLVDSLRFLFGKEFNETEYVETIAEENLNDPTITIKTTLGETRIPVWFKGWSENHYQIFDIELRFSTGRLKIENFEQRYQWDKCVVNSLDEIVLKPAEFELRSCDRSPISNAIDLMRSYLDGADIKVLKGKTLHDVVPSLTSLWRLGGETYEH